MLQSMPDDFLNTAPCGFLVFSDEGSIVTVNDTLLHLLHYKREELVGRSIESILTLANRIFYQTHLFPLIRLHSKADEIFLTLLTADSEEVHVLLNACRKIQDEAAYNHCILVPVQQRRKYENELLLAKKAAEEALTKNELLLEAQKKLEEQKQQLDRQVSKLTQMNRELMQFSKVISHDIQEPIRKIAIFADLALKEANLQGNSSLKDPLQKVSYSCLRMSRLVNSLEQYMSLDTAERKWQMVDLNQVIKKAKQMALESTGYEDAFKLEFQDLPKISGNRSQIELLFFHLIENAIKFRQPEKGVEVCVRSLIFQENSYKSLEENFDYKDVVKITFTDNGKGFETEHSNNLFQLFQKLQMDSQGTGLGLALCKKIVDNHYGEISVDSTPGQGTSFYIILPLGN
jgi:phosphoserine phosphatase RsbU/P